MHRGLVISTLLVVLAASQTQSAATGGCHLTESQVTTYLQPVLQFVRSTDANTAKDSTAAPKECSKQVDDLVAAVKNLAGSSRVVLPDADQDAAIADFRYQKAVEAFEALKQVVDAPTLHFLTNLEPELTKIRSKFNEIKKSAEFPFIRLIFNNTAKIAANETELLPNKAEFALQVIEVGYDPINTTNLKYLIDYANEFDKFEISISAYKLLFQKLKENNQLAGPDILHLFYCFSSDLQNDEFESQSEELKEEYNEFTKIITKYKDARLKSMVTDIGNFKASKFRELGEGYSDNVLSVFLPDIIEKYYSPPIPRKVANLIEVFKGLPFNDNDCVAVDALYHELSKHNQEETFEAFALLMYTKYVIHEAGGYDIVEDENKQKCSYVVEALSEFQDKFINKYVKLIGRKEWRTLNYWHKTYDFSMRMMLPDVINKVYIGDKKSVSDLTELTENLPYLEDDCVVHDSLISKVLVFKHGNTFEALEELAGLRATLELDEGSSLEKCKHAKKQAPEWIERLLWSDTSACKITNRKYNELLVVEEAVSQAGFDKVFTAPKDRDLQWKLTINKDGLTSFKAGSEDYTLHYNSTINKAEGDSDEHSINEWKLEHAEGDYFYIFNERTLENDVNEEVYISAKDALCVDSLRCLDVLPRANSHEMQWKIEC